MHKITTEEKIAEIKAKKAAYARTYYAKNKTKLSKGYKANYNAKKGRKAIKFTSAGKEQVRQQILKSAKETGDLFELFGASGENYHKVRKEAPKVNITSIDSGKDFKNEEALRKLFKKLEGCKVSTIKDHAKTATTADQKGTLWFDYCGPMSNAAIEDIEIAHKIMKHKGYFYITLLKARESFMAKDTAREVINEIIPLIIKKTFAKSGIKARPFYHHEYQSAPDYSTRKTNRTVPMGVYGFKFIKDEAFIKRAEKKTQKENEKKIKSIYTAKQIKEMVNTLNTIGYTITK